MKNFMFVFMHIYKVFLYLKIIHMIILYTFLKIEPTAYDMWFTTIFVLLIVTESNTLKRDENAK